MTGSHPLTLLAAGIAAGLVGTAGGITSLVSFTLIGLLAAIFILKEVYGYVEVPGAATPASRQMPR